MLYQYCDQHNVPYKQLGKLLVAAHDDQIPKLREFMSVGKKNGMTDLEWLNAEAAHELEPDLHCVAAIKSPSTGVISSQRYPKRRWQCLARHIHLSSKFNDAGLCKKWNVNIACCD